MDERMLRLALMEANQERFREAPWDRRGRDTAAPSGKFCRAMPRARAIAPARAPPSWAAMAKERPTAMPSGVL